MRRPQLARIRIEENAMAALPNMLTVAEFRELPEGGEFTYELHHGEVVQVTRPKLLHWTLQKRLERPLETRLDAFGVVGTELATEPSRNMTFGSPMSRQFRMSGSTPRT
jgi:hypothetical protein